MHEETKGKRNRMLERVVVAAVALAMTAGAVPLLAPTAEATHGGIHFGFQETNWNDLPAELPSHKYSAIWWKNNADGQQYQLQRAEQRGQIPVVHFYYWEHWVLEHDAENRVENGYGSKSKADWAYERGQLIENITNTMNGKETIVTIELEFNIGEIRGAYADTFEGYLLEHVNAFEAVPGVKTVVAFGEWGSTDWHKFSDAVAASSILGTQLLWTSKGHTVANGAERTEGALADLKSIFPASQGFPSETFIYDWGVSTWHATGGDLFYEAQQATEVNQLLQASDRLRNDYGLIGFVFRTINDVGDTSQNWGEAECCFGYIHEGVKKDAYWEMKAWMEQEAAADPPTGSLPSQIEAEDFSTKSTGGLTSSASYSGGAAWNIWTNGYVQESVNNPSSASSDLTVQAKGSLAGPDLPHMRLHVNGVVVAEWDVTTETVQPYTTTATLPAGSVTFRIEFTNDYVSGSDDRNLIVDVLEIGSSTPSEQWRQEAEAMACTVGGQSTDASASGGASWNLWSNGHCAATISTSASGPQDLRITARGDPAAGVWPQAKVYVDGSVVATWDIIDDDWLTYVVSVDMGSGSHSLEIHFVNDANINGDDRNLHLDVASVVG